MLPQWTWHAKGVWIIPKHSNSLLTVIGSSNLNHRSWTRDLETQLYIISHDDLLTKSLKCHLDSLYADSRPVDLTIVGRRRFHVVLKLATRIIRNML
ncbi:Tubulin polyglutamylase complex subunit 1 [Globomyces sp. JEL0801]|nr:Tubulin polyglutamylase complex subunit 1 [Globomyces sp. JEL0801]